ncbi:MAG: M15 family metallopeptidase [Spirochaetales bacterium]|jgi:hypothetical protein|nr:M15 family metallopeptidase [Spirochaetales bacterium]
MMKKRVLPVCLGAAFAAATIFLLCPFWAAAGGNTKETAARTQQTLAPASIPDPPPGEGLPGAEETLALAKAYPGRIAQRAFRGGDWALRIDEDWYAWANGRMLPEAEKNRWDEFTGLRFYKYPPGLPPLARLDEQAKTRLRERLAADRERPPVRSEIFLSRLFEAATREQTEARLVRVSLMGFSFRLHKMAAESLALVDKDLAVLARTDAEVRRFFEGISHIGSFNWRPIAGTGSRSYHSYGLALDFIAKNWGGKAYYWRNIMNSNENWFELPYEKRWMAPLPLVEVFEKHGFIWGGKWLYFDTVHFEYRPELLALRVPD